MSKRDKIDRRDLAPLIAEGLTQGVPVDRVQSELPPKPKAEPSPGHMNDLQTVAGTRVPLPRFFAEDDPSAIWTPEGGRTQRHVRITLHAETLEAMKAGMICLRCLEPQTEAFPFHCTSPPEMGCNYPISDRQLRDIAIEYEGEQTLGPTPIEL